jgi:hypothetical protein
VELDFVRMECDVETNAPVQVVADLHAHLHTFEVQFRASCCRNILDSCSSCSMQGECPYLTVFSQNLSSDPEVVRLHQKPSLPFALYIDEKGGSRGSPTTGMVVVGTALHCVETFHAALLRMVQAGVSAVLSPEQFTLRSYSLDYQGARHEIVLSVPFPESVILLSSQHILHSTVHSDSVRLSLKSPLRMLNNGSIAHRFEFAPFFRSQLRRCSSLCAYYGSGNLDLDFAQLSMQAENVTLFDNTVRYIRPSWTKRQNRAGLAGSVECAGLVEPMLPLLLLGSYFNAGKGAAFGAGYHRIEVE